LRLRTLVVPLVIVGVIVNNLKQNKMKKLIQFLFLTIVAIMWSNGVVSQNKLSLTGNRYFYSIKNETSIHLKVINDKSGESELLQPNRSWIATGNFGRKYFKKTRLTCKYDGEAYKMDNDNFKKNKNRKLNQAERNLSTYLASNDKKLLIQFGLIAGSNTTINDDDLGIIKFGKRIIRGGSELSLKAIDYFNTISELASIKTADDLIDYVHDNYGWEAQLRDQIIREIDFLNYKSRKRGINAVINWAEGIERYNRNYQGLISAINDEYQKNISYIDEMYKKGTIASYTLNEIVVGSISFKTKTPGLTISLSPLHYGNRFNNDWGTSKERLASDENGDDEYEFEDALWNRNFGGKIQFPISQEMGLGKKSQARLLLGIGYFNTAYSFDSRGSYSRNFFSEVNTADPLRILKSETMDDQRVSVEMAYKMYLGNVFTFELAGGLSQVKNYINYNATELGDGFAWANSKISLGEKSTQPYYGATLGIGKNEKHKGVHLIIGCRFFQFNDLELPDSYAFEDADKDLPINFKPGNIWNYRINVGLSLGF